MKLIVTVLIAAVVTTIAMLILYPPTEELTSSEKGVRTTLSFLVYLISLNMLQESEK